jgi:hypothetical protein
MIVKNNLFPSLKKTMFTATAVLGLMQCSPEEELVSPPVEDVAIEATSVSATEEMTIGSLTVTGINTIFSNLKDCKPCSYIVSANENVVDGKELNLKPGSIICLNKGVKYGDLEFVNVDGTEQEPIVIATVGAVQQAEPTEADGSNPEPY